jgi:YbbR domain-containing protein
MKASNAISRIRRLMLSTRVVTFLICLGIASLLWVVHALNKNYKYTLKVPVTFLNLPANKLIVGDLPETLDVEIKASGLKLIFISTKKSIDNILIDFNLLKNNAKSQSYCISNGTFNLKNSINFDVDVIKIRPDTLFFSSTKGKYKLLPIKANLKINCLPGYSIVSKPTITPAYVSVSGDSLDLMKIDTVYTNNLILKDIHENISSSVSLKKQYPSIQYSVKDVEVSFNVDKLTEATIKVPIQIRNNKNEKKLKLLPNYVTIKYLVAMKDYESITPNSFKIVVDYQQIIEKKKKLSLEVIRTPSEAKILNIEPSSISYLIYN